MIKNGAMAQLVKYDVHTTRKIKSIPAIFYHILLFFWLQFPTYHVLLFLL